jgi:hypothetical protein
MIVMEIPQIVYQCDQCGEAKTDPLPVGAPLPEGWKKYRLMQGEGLAGPAQTVCYCPACAVALAWPAQEVTCERCQASGQVDAWGRLPAGWHSLKLVAGPYEQSPTQVLRFCPACSQDLHLTRPAGPLPPGVITPPAPSLGTAGQALIALTRERAKGGPAIDPVAPPVREPKLS